MTKPMHDTPMLDQLEGGPWPSFVTGLKRLAKDSDMMVDLLGQLETSYETRKGYWKGGTVGVIGYGGGVIPRFTELKDENHKPLFPAAAEFHTLRIMPPPGMHYDSKTIRNLCDIWEKYGSGLIAFHGQSGDIMFQGCTTENVQKAFDEINKAGFDMGGAGPAVRTGMSCVGAARCEQSCYDEARAMRTCVNANLDDMHRPALPYKLKFKASGCANDCMNSIQRADVAMIGTWRDDIKVDQAEVKNFITKKGRKYVIDNVITRCPTQALSLNDDDTLGIDNHNCVRCMHCINVMTKALSPGDDKGVTILVGGKRTLKIGDLMGTVIVPFHKMETDEDYEWLEELSTEILDFFAENALEHERTGEMIERIGLINFLEGLGLEIEPEMISQPRTNPYVRTDDWDEEAAKWNERKAQAN
ncbi:MAG: dissimilatory-type sulfite reductase subunit alpha [Sedimenticola sp.]|uniref:Dissimilatory-type sulfite reductase subunit alpha n=1 Tax=Sedimenticola thiotaurini TaxID=1543721 RepID=A0A558CS21_9GAMM|nr:dissimilatory-type sulfite reductase subunit alpha [Sedimenticola sp.]TVT51560.1 MAG: dissimilatory-type sulfite reductase subunit alpha [Sedimenticola thiotaurini]MCW8883131.1 dissimilatory-type sulfite reductase subunit alpha [Sedimenticola sp.]MCW8921082.1 dissimilatory-type sulfite reductase subunit alpha [Sedimenticola sp.]MCW8947989.1 dissimilatory-type sulfite reductase subunit alpha [Sedimenticola sp.]